MTTQDNTQAVQVTESETDALYKMACHLAGPAKALLPDRWHDKPEEVFQMALQAKELGLEIVSACRLTYVIYGTPALMTAGVIGLVNAHAGLGSEIMFEERGDLQSDDYAVRGWAISGKSGEKMYGIWVGMDMAIAEGWTKKKGNKYGGPMRAQMLRYRAATFFARLFVPHVLMGLHTTQEVEEDRIYARSEDPKRLSSAQEALNERMRGSTEIVEPPAEEEPEAQESHAQEPEDPSAWPLQDANGEDIPF